MAKRIQMRRGTAAEWTAANPTLLAGEIGYETDTKKHKIGDGATVWTGLGYVNAKSPLVLTARTSTEKPLILQAAASQTANLQEWQDSAGTVLTKVWSDGSLHVGNGINEGRLAVLAPTPASKPLVVRGAASQTANLAEWQNSAGTVLTKVRHDGIVSANNGVLVGADVSYNAFLNVGITSASNPGLVVRGAASQTANLAEFQNSAGTVLAGFGPSGRLILNSSDMTSTSATAGSASALPANPAGYVTIATSGGGTQKIPYYNT